MTDLPSTSLSLLRRLQEKSNDAWADFMEVYGRAVYGFCRRRGLQDADAEDVCSQVMVALERMLNEDRFDATLGSFRGWVFRVARNLTATKFREKANGLVASGDTRILNLLSNHPHSLEKNCDALKYEYRAELFHWAAKRVQPVVNKSTWRAFWATAVEGIDARAVADELQTTVGNVYTAKCRVIDRIQKLVATLDDDPDMKVSGENK